jgi:hypothetical protein
MLQSTYGPYSELEVSFKYTDSVIPLIPIFWLSIIIIIIIIIIVVALQPLFEPWSLSLILILNTVGRTPSTGDQPLSSPLSTHRTTQTQNKRTQTSMPRVRFEPTIPDFERTKTLYALIRAATVIGLFNFTRGESERFDLQCDGYTSLNFYMYFSFIS